MVYDAVRVRLIEIGEAVKGLSADLLAAEPDLPWARIAGLRDRLAHRYFDTSHGIVQGTVDQRPVPCPPTSLHRCWLPYASPCRRL